MDSGFPAHKQIDAVDDKTEVDAPVPEHQARKDDQGNEMEHDKHAPKAECVNAQARNRGLQRMPLRGLDKMRCVVLLFALAHDPMRTLALAPQLLGLVPTPSAATATTA